MVVDVVVVRESGIGRHRRRSMEKRAGRKPAPVRGLESAGHKRSQEERARCMAPPEKAAGGWIYQPGTAMCLAGFQRLKNTSQASAAPPPSMVIQNRVLLPPLEVVTVFAASASASAAGSANMSSFF